MKNFTRVLSVVMAIAMLLTMSFTASAQTYTDVTVEDSYYEAVEALSALGVVKGYEEGDFQPEGKITRAEAATIIMRIMAMGAAESTRVNTQFSDVTSEHWASGVIAAAADSAIINGMGDGTFAPSAEVTYDQVVKMLVCAMGYEKKAAASVAAGTNVFPTGYNIVANQKRITEGTVKAEGGATRATVARLVYNALKVNLMDQTSFGTDVQFEEIPTQSILYTKLNAIEVETKIAKVSIDPTEAKIQITPSKYDDVATNNGYGKTQTINGQLVVPKYQISSVKKGDVDLAGLQGLTVKALIDINDPADPELLAVFPQAGKNVELVIDPQLFAGIDATSNAIKYYKDANATTVNTSSKLEKDGTPIATYINMNYLDTAADTDAEIDSLFNLSGTAKINTNHKAYRFVDTDNNGYYDTLFVDNSASFVVGKVNPADYEIYRDNSTSIFNSSLVWDATNSYTFTPLDLDTSDEDVSYVIKDAEGNAMAFEDIKAGDILTVAWSFDGTINYYDITVSTSSSVEGTISEVTTEKVKDSTETITYYVIDGTAYRVNAKAEETKLEAGTAGTFQITADGAIISYELEASARNYGIVVAVAAKSGSFSNGAQAQIVTKDGSIKTYDFASKVYVNDGAVQDTTTVSTDAAAAALFVVDDPATPGATLTGTTSNIPGTIVIYETNSDDEIRKIYTTKAAIQNKENADVKVKDIATAEYTAATGKIDGTYITENTVVIGIPAVTDKNDKDSYSYASVDALADAEKYDGIVVYDAASKEITLAFITNLVVKPAYDAIPMVITGKSTTNVDGQIRNKYTGYIENKEVSYVEADEEDLVSLDMTGAVNASAAKIGVNDVVQIVLNANEEIVSYRHILNWVDKYTDDNNTPDVSSDDVVVAAHYEALLSTEGNEDNDNSAAKKAKLYNLNTGALVNASEVTMYGYAVAGRVNKVSGRGIELFKDVNIYDATTNPTGTITSVAALTAASNIKDAAYNPNNIAYIYGSTYSKVQTGVFDSVKTFESVDSGVAADYAKDLAKADDVVYLYSFDGVNVLGFVVDVLSNNK